MLAMQPVGVCRDPLSSCPSPVRSCHHTVGAAAAAVRFSGPILSGSTGLRHSSLTSKFLPLSHARCQPVKQQLRVSESLATSSFSRRGALVHAGSLFMCSSASEAAQAMTTASADAGGKLDVFEKDILIVGPGVLGSLVAEQWIKEHPESKVVGLTNTTNSHERLKSLGVFPVAKGDLSALEEGGGKFPFVLFSAPPSGSTDYAGEVRAAAARWNGVGAFLFTSSSGVYGLDDGGWCDENCPVIPKGQSPRIDNLLNAEEESLKAGGNVVRLAGLYTPERGAHAYWMKQEYVPSGAGSYLNLIHYEDAASLAVAILKSRSRGKVYMGCDNHPLTRQELMDITLKSGKFEGPFKGFNGPDGSSMGKRMCNDATRGALNWKPKYPSFAAGLASMP